jgi:6-phosphogluconolactonase
MQATGSGPHRRQASPHAHGATVDPSGRFALVSDMGADRVFVYGFDRDTHVLRPDDASPPRSLAVAPGSGPRRSVFARDGRFVYVLNELSADVLTLSWDAAQGRLALLRTNPISSPDFQGVKSASEMALSKDGRYLYVTDRGEHAVVVFAVHPETGELSLLQRVPSGGAAPWAFDIDVSGHWMLVANQRSNRINLFRVDPSTGLLTDTGRMLESPGPVSIAFTH